MKRSFCFVVAVMAVISLALAGCGYNLKKTILPVQQGVDNSCVWQYLGDNPAKPEKSLAGKIHVAKDGQHIRQIVGYNGATQKMITEEIVNYTLGIPLDKSQTEDYGYKLFQSSAAIKASGTGTTAKTATGSMFVKNPGAPLVKWFPGDAVIRCVAAKAYRGYRKADPNECRLELCVYGGRQAEVEDPIWFDNWLNGSQRIVNPKTLGAYFANLDPNSCEWDENDNGGYRRWCAGDTTVSFRGWTKSSGITEERLPDGRTKMTVSEGALLFKTGSWDIQPEHDATLVAVYNRLYNTAGPIIVEGHTDNALYRAGSGMNNQILSEKRAQVVAAVLAGLGIDKSRISAKGYGATKPTAGTEMFQTEAERTRNRRVVIIFDPPKMEE